MAFGVAASCALLAALLLDYWVMRDSAAIASVTSFRYRRYAPSTPILPGPSST